LKFETARYAVSAVCLVDQTCAVELLFNTHSLTMNQLKDFEELLRDLTGSSKPVSRRFGDDILVTLLPAGCQHPLSAFTGLQDSPVLIVSKASIQTPPDPDDSLVDDSPDSVLPTPEVPLDTINLVFTGEN